IIVAQNSAVASRVLQGNSQNTELAFRGRDELPECLRTDQGHVAVEDQHLTRVVCKVIETRQRLCNGMAGTQLLCLFAIGETLRLGQGRQLLPHALTLMTVNDMNVPWLDLECSIDDMLNQWLACDFMQHFRLVGLHSGALSCGEYDDFQWHLVSS